MKIFSFAYLSHTRGHQNRTLPPLVAARDNSLGTFQGALGRLQEVLERFWAENIDFSLVFEGFGWQQRMDGLGPAAGLGPPKTSF